MFEALNFVFGLGLDWKKHKDFLFRNPECVDQCQARELFSFLSFCLEQWGLS